LEVEKAKNSVENAVIQVSSRYRTEDARNIDFILIRDFYAENRAKLAKVSFPSRFHMRLKQSLRKSKIFEKRKLPLFLPFPIDDSTPNRALEKI